ncbi:MAG: thiol-disulfide isomerase/thioredoxin [Planctomycetota bacterium]|jgi:thiol-disulfide isomerase/thioredoxin
MLLAPLAALVLTSIPCPSQAGAPAEPVPGAWEASITSPGGPVEFGLEIEHDADGWSATIRNGPEKLPVGKVNLTDGVMRFDLWPYESHLNATIAADGRSMQGTWLRTRGNGEPTRMVFQASLPKVPTAPRNGISPVLKERWKLQFESASDHSVALLYQSGREVAGTILTTVGDYRFLSGYLDGITLTLSAFDGAHAFRFVCKLQSDGSMQGDFWSRDTWHETFTATPDDKIEMPDPYGLSTWTGKVPLAELSFPDPDGEQHTLDDPAYAGSARLIVLFGTWCPNCYDETRYLNELEERYGPRGLSILGLAFEYEDEFAAQAKVVKHYIERMKVSYPVLIAGPNDKAKASAAFPALDRVVAYPTTLFLDAQGTVQAVHTGFSGPATGPRNALLRREFEARIESLLAQPEDR